MYSTSVTICDSSGFIFTQWITYHLFLFISLKTYLRFQGKANWRNYLSLSSECESFLSKERLTFIISLAQDKVSRCMLI